MQGMRVEDEQGKEELFTSSRILRRSKGATHVRAVAPEMAPYPLCRHEAPPVRAALRRPLHVHHLRLLLPSWPLSFPNFLHHFFFVSFLRPRGVEAAPRHGTFEGPAAYVSTNKESFLSLVSPFFIFFFLLFFFFFFFFERS